MFIGVYTRTFLHASEPHAFPVVIAGTPGKTVGACLQALGFALVGIGLGAVGFVVLAELGNVPVAQGFVLAVFVYFMALLKARGIRYVVHYSANSNLISITFRSGGLASRYSLFSWHSMVYILRAALSGLLYSILICY
jgi:hypothetical protein